MARKTKTAPAAAPAAPAVNEENATAYFIMKYGQQIADLDAEIETAVQTLNSLREQRTKAAKCLAHFTGESVESPKIRVNRTGPGIRDVVYNGIKAGNHDIASLLKYARAHYESESDDKNFKIQLTNNRKALEMAGKVEMMEKGYYRVVE